LRRLQELDLVVREVPFGEPEKAGKRTLYKLADPFMRLWFSVVAPRRGLLAQAPKKARLAAFDAIFPRLIAQAWEDLCRQAVPRLGDWGPARRFWHRDGPEWDIVAERHGALLAGEAKWSERGLEGAARA